MDENDLMKQSDLEQLSAWMDGELPSDQADHIAKLVEQDDDWRAAYEQFCAVDQVASMLAGTITPPKDLPERIIRTVYRRRRIIKVLRIAAPVAAAACILIALWVGGVFSRQGVRQTTSIVPQKSIVKIEKKIDTILKDINPEDRFIVQNLTLFKEYPRIEEYRKIAEVVDADTLSALEVLEGTGRM